MALWFAIPTVNYLNIMADWDYHMVIAPHMLNNEKYKTFYLTHPGLYTLIDNGLWEGQVVSNGDLLNLAVRIQANEIICPDDATAELTIEKTIAFLKYIHASDSRNQFYLHGVVHGHTHGERMWCLHRLLALDIDIIDLPKMLGAKDRAIFLDEVTKLTSKPIHFLGYYKEEKDLLSGQWCTRVRSFDTSVPFKPNYKNKFDLNLPITKSNNAIIDKNIKQFITAYAQAGGDSI